MYIVPLYLDFACTNLEIYWILYGGPKAAVLLYLCVFILMYNEHMLYGVKYRSYLLDIRVELFGSTYSQFALKDSDVNMNLIFKDSSMKRVVRNQHNTKACTVMLLSLCMVTVYI